MALLNLIGFETGDTSEVNSVNGTCSVQSSVARTGTYAARCNPTTTATGFVIPDYSYGATAKVNAALSGTENYYGFAFRVDTLPGSNDEEILYASCTAGDASNVAQFLRITSGGLIRLYNGSTPSLVVTGTTALSTATWYYLELWLGSGDGAATDNYELRIDGVTEFSGTAQFGSGGATRSGLWLGKVNNRNSQSVDYYFDDIYMADDGFKDAVKITVAVPTGNSAANTHWSVAAGQKWEAIDEIPPTNTAEITSATTAGDRTYSATHASAATLGVDGDIAGVKVVARMSEVSSTTTRGAIGIRSGTTNFVTTAVDIGNTADITMAVVHGVDPNTSAAWTESAFDAAEPLVRRTSSDTSNIACSALYLMVAWVEAGLVEIDLAGAMGAPSGTVTPKTFEEIAGAQGAPSGTIARQLSLFRSVAGAKGAPSGSIASVKTHLESVDGARGAPSGTVVAEQSLNRTVTGAKGAPSGALTPQQSLNRTLAGAHGAPSGTLSVLYQIALAGLKGSPSGDITTLTAELIAGTHGAPEGDLVIEWVNKIIQGAKGSPSGTLAAQQTLLRLIEGAKGAPSGTIAALIAQYVTVSGVKGQPAGELTTAWLNKLVEGAMGAPSGSLDILQRGAGFQPERGRATATLLEKGRAESSILPKGRASSRQLPRGRGEVDGKYFGG